MTKVRKTTARPARSKAGSRSHRRRWFLVGTALVALVLAGALLWRGQRTTPPETLASQVGFQLLGTIQAADYHSLVFSPTDPQVLYFGHHNGVLHSRDGGRTWTPVVSRPGFDAMQLAVSPAHPERLWMAGHEVFYQSQDGGNTWSEVPSNLPGLDLHAFTVSASDPNVLYAFAVGFGLFSSSDAGQSWEPFGPGAPRLATALATRGTPEVLYIGTDQGLVLSRDRGQSFSPPIPIGGSPVLALAAPSNTELLYAGTPQGLFRSADGGQSWQRTGYTGQVLALAVSPTNPERVVFVDRQGKVWGKV